MIWYDREMRKARRRLRKLWGETRSAYAGRFAKLLVQIERVLRAGGDPDTIIRRVRALLIQIAAESEELVSRRQREAVRLAIDGHKTGYERAAEALSVDPIGAATIAAAATTAWAFSERRRGIEVRMASRLVRMNYVRGHEAFTDYIRSGWGGTYREAADDVLGVMGRHPRIADAVRDMGSRGEAVRRAIERAGRAKAALDAPARGLYTNAERVLLHEMNAMFHEADIHAASKSPAVVALRFLNSDRHTQTSSYPDECTAAARSDFYDLGPGVYPAEVCPSYFHPNCGDYTERVYRPENEWGNPKPEYGKPSIPDQASMRRTLATLSTDSSPTLTPRRVAHIQDQIDRNLRTAYDAARD